VQPDSRGEIIAVNTSVTQLFNYTVGARPAAA
jgi:hypothetical protein